MRLPDVKPRQKLSYENLGNGRFALVLLQETEVPVVKARRVNGRWIGAEVKLDRKVVVDSLREDREAR